jgi:hypothetical protein
VLGFPRQIEGLASAARTATTTKAFAPAEGAIGLTVVVVATAKGAAPSVVFNVEAFDEASQTWFNVLTPAAMTLAAPTTAIYRVDPRITAAANLTAQDHLYPKMRINAVAGNSDSYTYSVGLILSA